MPTFASSPLFTAGPGLKLARAACVLVVVAALAGCGKSGSQTAAAQSPAPAPGAAPPPTPVHVVQVSPQNLPILFEAVGQTEGSKQVEVRARVSGILQQR